ncbi:heme o synthase [Paracoccaceae bacterium]|nr:heme o synthase [Paracoccaceae bacterium]
MSTLESIDAKGRGSFKDLYLLLKPRVMWLAVFTAAVGLIVAPVQNNLFLSIIVLICISIGAGAAGVLNMWWDKELDNMMERTNSRPIPNEKISSDDAFVFGLSLSIFSVMFLGLVSNWLAAFLLALTIFFYLVIYSMFLKKTTPQNIVIGGAAGAMPPLIGWVATTGTISIEPLLLFLFIFFWTPPHFWSLAIITKDDYAKASIPMFPVLYGVEKTRRSILHYTVILVISSQVISFSEIGGPVFFLLSNVLNAVLLLSAVNLVRFNENNGYERERRFFKFTILYLFLYFGFLVLSRALETLEYGLSLAWPVLL